MVTRQIVLDGIPSTCEIYSFLTDNKIWVKSSKGNGGHCFSEEDEQSLVGTCICIDIFIHPCDV